MVSLPIELDALIAVQIMKMRLGMISSTLKVLSKKKIIKFE